MARKAKTEICAAVSCQVSTHERLNMGFYDRHILPKVLNWSCGMKPVQKLRQKVVPLAEGCVLEIGIGSGLNLPYYDPGKVERVIGLDPADEMLTYAKRKSESVPESLNRRDGHCRVLWRPAAESFADRVVPGSRPARDRHRVAGAPKAGLDMTPESAADLRHQR